MDFFNEKTRNLKQGAIRAMFDKANKLNDVISMGIGEPDMATPSAICNACKIALDKGNTHYTPNAGFLELRQAIAELSTIRNVGYDPTKEIIVTNGGMGALSLLMAVILNPGDEILMQDPQWLNYVAQIEYYGGKVVRVPTTAESGFEMQPEVIEPLITSKTKALMINTPNNPTGFVTKQATLQKIAELAIKHDIMVITDEVYNTLQYDGASNRSTAELPGMKDRTVVINSFSKSYAMTGWRIGYAAGPENIIKRMTVCQENFNSCANAPGQMAAIYALQHPEYTEELCATFENRRKIMVDALRDIPGMEFMVPNGAFYVFPNVTAFGLDDKEFCNRLLDEKRVVCIPGSAFGSCGAGHIRMAYTTDNDSLRHGMDRIATFCAGLK